MLNKHELIGRLGQDPEMRYLPSGDAVANVSVATTESWKNKDGERQEKTEWHRVVFFGKLAEVVGQYLKKGALVYVCGRGETKKYQANDGTDRYSYQIRADEMKMLGGKQDGDSGERQQRPQGGGQQQRRQDQPQQRQGGGGFDDMDDDIPF